MIRKVLGEEFAEKLGEHLPERELVKQLVVSRCVKGFTEKDMAKKLGYSEKKISKIEYSKDLDLTLGDLVAYAEAIGLDVDLSFSLRNNTLKL